MVLHQYNEKARVALDHHRFVIRTSTVSVWTTYRGSKDACTGTSRSGTVLTAGGVCPVLRPLVTTLATWGY